MTPPRARTWGRIGQTPVVRVRGRGSGRVSMARMACYKPGQRPRLIWDKVRLHLAAGMRDFIDANAEWLTVFQLPTYAPDLNPTEGVWSVAKGDIGNLAATDLGQITRAVKRKLKMLQYRPEAIDGCLAGTELALDL
ncbi:transposase [Streptomyces nigra]|uniref:transposase n=2 Tax=Streptomyces TaxID=1883 RepID=UPI001B397327|nr:transposase [Streptomyces sp. RK62]